MNNKILEFIQCLETQKLNVRHFDTWTDRQSGVYVVRAEFIDGQKFSLHLTDTAMINAIDTLSQTNLKSQFRESSEFRDLFTLTIGERFTLASMGEFGFCNSVQFTLKSLRVGKYAQYDDCVELIVKPKNKRTLRSIQFYGRRVFALWNDWVPVNTDAFGPPSEEGPFITRRSRYLSCDERFLTDAISTVLQKPFITHFSSQNNQQGAINE